MAHVIYNRIQQQLFALERSIRALRAGLENELASERLLDSDLGPTVPIRTAMEMLLSSRNPFPPKAALPNDEFFPGLYCGYSRKDVKPVTVHAISFSLVEPDEPTEQSTCLVARIPIESKATHNCSFEITVDRDDLLLTKSLVTRFVCCFRGPEPRENLKLCLRLQVGSEYKDYCTRSFPALDTPFEFTFTIDSKQYRELPVKEATEAWFLMTLPVPGGKPYEFLVSYFEAKGDPA
jgi:hypothetical protein